MRAWAVDVDERGSPGVRWQLSRVGFGVVVLRLGVTVGLCDQCFEPLVRRRIVCVVEAVQIERRANAAQIALDGRAARLVAATDDIGHEKRADDAYDHDDDHDLDQGEASVPCMVRSAIRVHISYTTS